ncbi:MAG TPA: succinylglutamate desuccinylase, partial [Firmicutes bacterium]|nr:succinylglutamate desuccinylase [Bacillota bacterium]
MGEHLKTIKLVAVVLTLICVIYAGYQFYEHRNFAETVVIGEGVTEVKKLSDYYEPLKDTINDCNIYIFDGKRP